MKIRITECLKSFFCSIYVVFYSWIKSFKKALIFQFINIKFEVFIKIVRSKPFSMFSRNFKDFKTFFSKTNLSKFSLFKFSFKRLFHSKSTNSTTPRLFTSIYRTFSLRFTSDNIFTNIIL